MTGAIDDAEQRGLIPRIFSYLFQCFEKQHQSALQAQALLAAQQQAAAAAAGNAAPAPAPAQPAKSGLSLSCHMSYLQVTSDVM